MSLQATSETTSTCARTSPLIRVIIRTFILTLTMGFKLASANATGDSSVAVVRSAINEAVPVFQNRQLPAQQRNQQLRAIAHKYFDFDYMTRFTMGTHWRSLTHLSDSSSYPCSPST